MSLDNIEEIKNENGAGKLREMYIEPPFSVLDSKTGSWQKRKNQWKDLGIKSEIGRTAKGGNSFNDRLNKTMIAESTQKMAKVSTEPSIFDPALTELMYKWFCPEGGTILDPFAGGSVRGVVAQKLGYKYTGIELRQEQVDSNIEQAKTILEPDNQPTWICGDSDKILDTLQDKEYDFIFSCPPYFDLEVYSDLEDDLSNMDWFNFKDKYHEIIKKSFSLLKNGGYAVFVVGDIRDKKGDYLDFIGETKKSFMAIDVGGKLYNDMIYLQPIGSASLYASNAFKNKKVAKIHQNVLCFRKP